MFGYQWVIWHCSAVHIDDVIVFVLILSHGTLFSFFSATLLKRKIKPSQLPGCVTKQQHSSSPPPPPPHTNFMTFKDENTMKVCFEEFYMSCWCRNKKEMPSISSPLPWKKNPPLQRTSCVLSLFGTNRRTMWLSSAIAVTEAENREKVPPVETSFTMETQREKTQDIVIHC